MMGARGDQLDQETAQRVPDQKRRPVQLGDERHQVGGVVTKAQRCNLAGTLMYRQFMMAQRWGMHREATFFEGRPSEGPLLPAAPRAVNQNDVLALRHATRLTANGPLTVTTSELPRRHRRLLSAT